MHTLWEIIKALRGKGFKGRKKKEIQTCNAALCCGLMAVASGGSWKKKGMQFIYFNTFSCISNGATWKYFVISQLKDN